MTCWPVMCWPVTCLHSRPPLDSLNRQVYLFFGAMVRQVYLEEVL